MKKLNVFLMLMLLCSVMAFSQKTKTDANVNGHVINAKTQEHLPFITVSVKGTTNAVYTDASGHYFIKNLPKGKLTLMVSGVGYKSDEKEVVLEPGKTIELNFLIEEASLDLEGVVVSANRNETKRKEAPTIVNVLTPKLFDRTSSVCLAQGLSYQPGLRIETNCQNCGFQQVRMNGLEGTYSQILIDSRPIFSALAGVYGIEQIPVNMIERVEVVRGGGSAIFGSNAIGGTINIITKEPNANAVSIANSTNFINGKTPDVNTNINASIVSQDYRVGVVLFGSTRQRAAFDYDDDGFSEIGKVNLKNVGFRGYYRLNDYSKISVEYHNLYEFRRGGNKLDLPPHQADIAEQTEHDVNTGGLKYDFFSKDNKHRLSIFGSTQFIDRKSYYGAGRDTAAYGTTKDKTFVAGTQYNYSMDKLLFLPADLTAGIEYSYNHLKDEMPGYHRSIDQEINIGSFFLQNEWKRKDISVLLGFRLDKHDMIKDMIFSPRVNLRYSLNELVAFRASYSTGFRAPQTFDEDLHVAAVGGEVSLISNASDLDPEKSQSVSGSVDFNKNFGHISTNLLIEGFYTDLDKVFKLEEIGKDADGNLKLERRNASGAVVKGINIEAKVAHGRDFQVQMGMTFQTSKYAKPEKWSEDADLQPQRTMFRSPNNYGFITIDYNPFKTFDISLSGTYTGSMLVQHTGGPEAYIPKSVEKETDPFFDLNAKIGYEFNILNQMKLELNGGIKNMFNSYQKDFDKGEKRDSKYVYGPSLPRTLFVGLKISL